MGAAVNRCPWARNDLSIGYHDHECGVPQHDDRKLFELLILEGAQAGLSWDTILKKRENYRTAFDGFITPQNGGLEIDLEVVERARAEKLASRGEFSVQAMKRPPRHVPPDFQNLRKIVELQSGRSRV